MVNAQPVPELRQLRDCGDLDLRIHKDGSWSYRGSPIGRAPLVKLFASVLRREADGSYWLVTPVERGRVAVDDAPFTIVELRSEGEGPARTLRLRTNLDAWTTVDAAHPLRAVANPDGTTSVYATVQIGRNGDLDLEGRLLPAPFYELVDLALADSDDIELAVWSGGQRFVVGRVDSDADTT